MIDLDAALRDLPAYLFLGLLWWVMTLQTVVYGVDLFNWELNEGAIRDMGFEPIEREYPTEAGSLRKSRALRAAGLGVFATGYVHKFGIGNWKWILVVLTLTLAIIVVALQFKKRLTTDD